MNNGVKTDAEKTAFLKDDSVKLLLSKLSDALAIGFFSVDYRGEVLSGSFPEKYFQSFGDSKGNSGGLKLIFAMAGVKSAFTNMPYLFYSFGRYVNMVIPVIMDDQYIGAVVGGPVLSSDDELHETTEDLTEEFLKNQITYRDDITLTEISSERIRAVSEVVFCLVREMGANVSFSAALGRSKYEASSLEVLKERNKELEEKIQILENRNLSTGIPTEAMLNMLNIASSFAVLEDSHKTAKILYQVSDFIRYHESRMTDETTIAKEFEEISSYLSVISEQFSGKLEHRISCREGLNDTKIPMFSVYPFVQIVLRAMFDENVEGGRIYIDAERKGNDAVISLQIDDEEKKIREISAYKADILRGSNDPDVMARRFKNCGHSSCRIAMESNMINITFAL